MNKLFSFGAGALCGALVGAVTAILLAPTSGEELRLNAKTRWDEAIAEATRAKLETEQQLNVQFELMKEGRPTA